MRGAKLRLLALALATTACAAIGVHPAMVVWKEHTVELRGLEFERPVNFEWIERTSIPEVIGRLMDGAYPAGHLESYHDAYAALGALPADIDLRALLLALQEDQLLGLYDPRSETMYVVITDDDPETRNATVTHELVHALQHQHNEELFALQQHLRHNDDVVTSIAVALEGDASFTMLEQLWWGRRTVVTADRMRDAMLFDLEHPEDGLFAEAPRLLQVSLFFGYTYGPPIAARYYEALGNAGLDELLRDPPLSTLQAIALDNDNPIEFIALPEAELRTRLAARGCTLGHHNVAGVLTTQVVFELHEGKEPPPGRSELLRDWYGDRFLTARCGDARELAWLTRWRSAPAAEAFATRYRAIAESVSGMAPLSGPPAVHVRGTAALVLSPGLAPERDFLLERSEARAYAGLAEWMADDCFSESPCPRPGDPPGR